MKNRNRTIPEHQAKCARNIITKTTEIHIEWFVVSPHTIMTFYNPIINFSEKLF